MKKISKYKVDKWVLIPLIIMAIISVCCIASAELLINNDHLVFKQIIWYVIGFGLAYFIMFIGNEFIYRNIWYFYGFGIVALILLLLFATPINNARCWFIVPSIGTIQPSEFMKIILIITIGSMINNFREKYDHPSVKEEFLFLTKILVVVLIPSLLTFLQPDTGIVLIYLIITVVMLFIAGIRYRWFIILFSLLFLAVAMVVGLYFLNTDLFIKIFGSGFFLRVDRLLDWSNKSGYQLENGMTAIGSAGLVGYGLFNTPLYFPEPQTDFIFAVYSSNFGFIGSILLIGLITLFDIVLVNIAIKCSNNKNKYILGGIIGMLVYQQVQNISMTFGLMPITGITLPFISYGGSSLLSYMLIAGIIFNISNETIRYTNKT